MNPRKQFRKLLEDDGLVVAPGAYDVISSILINKAGFPAVYYGSMAASATLLGVPDIGIISCTEYVSMVTRIVENVDIPVIADAENGYGDLFSVRRAVQDFERAGVSAMHIEDHAYGKHIDTEHGLCIDIKEMVGKIKAACDARKDPDTVIIARTDLLWIYKNIDLSLERACAYAEAGADMIFIANIDEDNIEKAGSTVPVPMLITSGFTECSHSELENKGIKVLIYFAEPLLAAYSGVKDFLDKLSECRSPIGLFEKDLKYQDIDYAVNIEKYRKLFRKYQGSI